MKPTLISSLNLWIQGLQRSSYEEFVKGLDRGLEVLRKHIKGVFLLFMGAYRTLGTNHFGGSCRFEPSCSAYAVEAIIIIVLTTRSG